MTEGYERTVEQMLDTMAELEAQRELLRLDVEGIKEGLIPDDVKQQLLDMDVEYAVQFAEIDSRIALLDEQIRMAVLSLGDNVKGQYRHAVYVKGRVSWDTRGLDKLSYRVPEVMEYRREGQPSVRIGKI